MMNMDIENLVTITEADQDFSRITRIVDERGSAIILKNCMPYYVLLDFKLLHPNFSTGEVDIEAVASRMLANHIEAFENITE
jgi:antitoxin Phd